MYPSISPALYGNTMACIAILPIYMHMAAASSETCCIWQTALPVLELICAAKHMHCSLQVQDAQALPMKLSRLHPLDRWQMPVAHDCNVNCASECMHIAFLQAYESASDL